MNSSKFVATPTTSSRKFTMHQKTVENKNIPRRIQRSLASPEKIIIERKDGEGKKPLFSRSDIVVNQPLSGDHHSKSIRRVQSTSSSDDSSPEPRHRSHRESIHQRVRSAERTPTPEDRRRRDTQNARRDRSHSPKQKRAIDKVPYYLDENRERDRIRKKHYSTASSTSRRYEERRRSRSRSRSRSYERRRRTRSSHRSRRSRSRSYDRRRRSSREGRRSRSRTPSHSSHTHNQYDSRQLIPVIPFAPMEYPYHPGWFPSPYARVPYMIRPPMAMPPHHMPPPPNPYHLRPPAFRPRFPGRPPPRQNFRPRIQY